MSKVVHKKETVALTVSSNQVVGVLDITNCNGVSVQINGIAGTAGTIKLQRSNDNTNWEDISGATATLGASVPKIIDIGPVYIGHVRALVTLSGGAGTYDVYFLGKER